MTPEMIPQVINKITDWLKYDDVIYLNEGWYASKTKDGFIVVKAGSETEAKKKLEQMYK